MGKDWDHGIPGQHFWEEALRVAKPGAHLLAFGGTRTFHRLAVAIEDAGWEIRDTIMWVYGSGFPKSLDVSKAVEAHLTKGGSGTVMMRQTAMGADYTETESAGTFRNGSERAMNSVRTTPPDFNPRTDEGKQMQGWGTALKPAWEPIIVARKPLKGTVAANVLEYGTGGLNIDGCRVGFADDADKDLAKPQGRATTKEHGAAAATPDAGRGLGRIDFPIKQHDDGRWPANVVHDGSDEVLAGFPESKDGVAVGGLHSASGVNAIYARMERVPDAGDHGYGGSGSASRFFYTAKTSRSERNAGLDWPKLCSCSKMAEWDGEGQREATQAESDIPPRRDTTELSSEGGNDSSTTPFGNSTEARSLADTKSTMSTGTSRTTGSTTNNYGVCPDCGGVSEGAFRNTHPT